jgi:broad specificity phosphatase PhoE
MALQKQDAPTIYLIRHESTGANDGSGTSDGKPHLRGWNDFPVDEPGMKDLPKLANFFTAYPIKHIVTADLQRHITTGLAIAQKHNTTFTPSMSFRPWDNASGAWKDRPINRSLTKEMRWYVDHPEKPAPGGESFGDYHSRLAAGMDSVMEYVLAHPKEPTGIVMSTRGVGSTLYHLYGDRSHIVGNDVIAPGGVIRLQHDGQKWNMSVLRKGLGNKPAIPNARYGSGKDLVIKDTPNPIANSTKEAS